MRIAELKGTLEALLFIIFVTFMQNGPGRMMKRKFQQQMARGETIWLDDLETRRPLPPEQERRSGADVSADISPNHAWQPRKSRAIKLDEYPEAAYPFSYRRPPLSGNVINGLGEKQTRPARKVFHSGDYRVAWGGLERYFHAHANDTTIKKFRKIRWQDRQKDGRAASVKYQVDSPEQMAVWVKEAAAHFGGQLVGVAPLSAEHTFEHFDPSPRHHGPGQHAIRDVRQSIDGRRGWLQQGRHGLGRTGQTHPCPGLEGPGGQQCGRGHGRSAAFAIGGTSGIGPTRQTRLVDHQGVWLKSSPGDSADGYGPEP
jgi:hypothetical protein